MPMQPIGGPLQFDQGPLGAPLQAAPAAPKKKGGMFGSGLGFGEALVAALNGYLAARGNPAGAMNMQMIAQHRREQDQEKEYQRHRSDQFDDWVKQQAYKAANPDPGNPHYFEDNSGNQMAIGPDGKPHVVYEDPNPWKFIPNGMGGVVPVNVRSLMQGQGAPQAPVGKLTPIAEGGPGPIAPGGFPR